MKKRLIPWLILALALALGLSIHALADAPTPYLRVNGSESSASVAFNEAPVIRIYAPGATAVRLLANRLNTPDDPKSWDRYFDHYEVSLILEENGMRMFDSGTWLITADYITEDYDDETDLRDDSIGWIPIGGGVTVQVADYVGQLDAPAAVLSSTSVNRGDTLTVTVSAFQHVDEWYWIDMERMNGEGDWEYLGHIDTGIEEGVCDSFALPTVALDPGIYRLWLRTEAVHYEDNGVRLLFTVNASAGPLPDMALYFPDDTALAYQQILFYGYAEDADRMEVEVRKAGDPNWENRFDMNGGFDFRNWSSSDDGVYIFTLRAWWGDTVREADPFTLTLSAPYGNLDAPRVLNLDPIRAVGEALDCAFAAVPNAMGYHIRLEYRPDDGNWDEVCQFSARANGNQSIPVQIPGVVFERPGMYWLQVHAHALGFNGGHTNRTILVTEPMDEDLALTVNGGTDDIEGWLSHRGFHVDVAFPEGVTALRLLNDDHWDCFDANDFHGVDWAFGAGDYALIAMASEDTPVWREDDFDWGDFSWEDLDWSAISNAVHVNVVAPYGPLDTPTLIVPETVARGEWLSATVGAVQNAEVYHLDVYRRDENGREYGWTFSRDLFSAGEVLIPTANMEAGERLFIRVWAGAEGYDGSDSPEKTFTVTDGGADERFLVSSTDVLTLEDVRWSVFAPGAECVRVTCGAELFSEEFDDALVDSRDFDRPGDYELKAIVPDGDGWRVIGEPVTIHVSAPYGRLEAEIDAPASVAADGTAEFTVTWHHNGVHSFFETTLNNPYWNDQPLETVSFTAGDTETVAVYRVDATQLSGEGIYVIETVLRPDVPGYTPTWLRAELPVVDGAPQGTVTVSRSEVLRCEESTVTVDVPGATALWVYHGEGRWDGFTGSHIEVSWPFYMVGDNRVYARYTTQTIDDPWDVDYDELDWTGTTPVATVRVNSVGVLRTPDFTLQSEIVKRGEPFRITINALQGHDEWYIASLRGMDDQEATEHFFWDETSRTVRVETAGVESDLYFLELHGDAVGYESCDVRLFVAVEEADEGLTVSLPDLPVLTQEYRTVAACAPGAESIALTLTCLDDNYPHTIEQPGDSFCENMLFSSTACTCQLDFTATYADGHTLTRREYVDVTAPYGYWPSPTLHMPGEWIEGQDLRFRIDAGSALFFVVEEIQDRRTGEAIDTDGLYAIGGDGSFTVPANLFTPGHPYDLFVVCYEIGYHPTETIFRVAPMPQNPSTFTLPAALSQVESEAFAGTAAQKIVIPATVTSVADRAFADCPNILAVEIENGASGISTSAFDGSGAFMVYGASGSTAQAYANANPWATFICLD